MVTIRFECGHRGCVQECSAAFEDLVDLSVSSPGSVWVEARVSVPADWHVAGGVHRRPFVVRCPEHVPAAAR